MKKIILLYIGLFSLWACHSSPTGQKSSQASVLDEDAYAQIFTDFDVHGTFVLHQLHADRWSIYNEARADSAYLPASTFKIPNSLIALECEVIKDENEVIRWDRIQRPVKAWNKDQDLRNAIRISAVWFYQHLARRIGQKQMQQWVDRLEYGNQNTADRVDNFWLEGALRITAREQITFLEKLYRDRLPCTPRNMDIVKDILIREKTEGYTLRGKTGWAAGKKPGIGWYVGWLEEGGEVYFFALNIDIHKNEDAANRQKIGYEILRQMGLMKK